MGCFAEHLREAIASNESRLPRYREMSGGKTTLLSRELIASERLSLVTAWAVDRQARRFQKAGVPVACDDFVSMDLVPPFRDTKVRPKEPRTSRVPVTSLRLVRALRAGYRKDGFPGVHRAAKDWLRTLGEPREYDCMTRHVLESIARVAFLAPQYEALAREKGIKRAPTSLSWRLVDLHLLSLPLARKLDDDAAPLQEAGIPILCQDVPPIETEPVLRRVP